MTYIAGFDILYACQDADFDRDEGLCSIPARFGPKRSFTIAAGLHLLSFLFLVAVHFAFDMGPVYAVGVCIIGALYVVEHRLVSPDDLCRIDIAFFHVNSVISVLLFFTVLADELLRHHL